FSHNPKLEVIWTLIPTLMILALMVPSIRLLQFMERTETADLVIKAIGRQWYWSYEYPDHKLSFDSYMIADKDLKPEHVRLLSVDHPIVVPVGAKVRLMVTGGDVLHSFAVPALGVKQDAVPGRLRETWFQITKPGIYYGQCSELCGVNHGFMPIEIRAVSQEEYQAWLKDAAKKFAAGPVTLVRNP
ncbi:MAG: cytochrome c oxidase subunit II, partial [Holosporales bacterium]